MHSTTTEVLTQVEEDPFPWLKVTERNECNEVYSSFKKYINHVVVLHEDIQQEQDFFMLADDYADATSDSNLNKYRECFDLVEEGRIIIDAFLTVLELIIKITQSDLKDAAADMKQLMDNLKWFHARESIKDFDATLEQACGLRKEFSDLVRAKAEMYKTYITQARFSVIETTSIIIRLYESMHNVYLQYTFLNNIYRYLYFEITKQELAEQFLSRENTAEREKFLQDIKNMEDLLWQYEDQVSVISMLMLNGYPQVIWSLPVIIMNDTTAKRRLELVKKAKTVKFITDWDSGGWLELICIKIVNGILDGPIAEINRIIMDPLRDIRDKIKTVEPLTERVPGIHQDGPSVLSVSIKACILLLT